MTSALVTALQDGNLYVNCHTVLNPGGEIRGQAESDDGDGRSNIMIGGAEVPPVGLAGFGTASAILTDMGIVFRTTVSGLTSTMTGAHFHNAPPGSNGPVVRDLSSDFVNQTADGVWMATDPTAPTVALIEEFVRGNINENVHTLNNPGGETRSYFLRRGLASVRPAPLQADGLRPGSSPNPVPVRTLLSFFLPAASEASLKLYDIAGRDLRTLRQGSQPAGRQKTTLDVSGLSQGMYLCRLSSAGRSVTQKLFVVR